MIKDVLKYLIYGSQQDLDQFFLIAQERGFLEFIAFDTQKKMGMPSSLNRLAEAIKIVMTVTLEPSSQKEESLNSPFQIAEDIIDLKLRLEKLDEEEKSLQLEKSRISPLGDFSMDQIAFIEKAGKRKIQFFCMNVSDRPKAKENEELLFITTENDIDYFMGISREGMNPSQMMEMRVDVTLEEVRYRLDFIANQRVHLEKELKESACYLDLLRETFITELNAYNLTSAKKNVIYPLKAQLFFSKVWIPSHKVDELFELMETLHIQGEPIALDPSDKVPTYLENQGVDLIGEDLIKIYDTPSIRDKDPSRWVLGFFALFFAIIVGDAGYGVLFLAAALYFQRKLKEPSESVMRSVKLMKILSVACIGWGVMTASYFGIQFSPDHPLMQISPIQALVVKKADFHLKTHDAVYQSWEKKFPLIKTASSGKEMLKMASFSQKGSVIYPMMSEFFGNIILELSLFLGIVHLTLSMVRNIKRHVAGLGWSFVIIGGYLFFPSLLNAVTLFQFTGLLSSTVATTVGLECMGVGFVFATFAALIQHGMKGIGELLHVIQVIADVLSYLRLYALSLAGAIMATTFNREGSRLGLVTGFIILLAGHLVNITLALMGGVIHGLRLNFLEWYRYCFEGNGKLFNPLQKLKIKG
ncbi:V-type ATP synthase subunit I [Rhabdochlamydiaceae symbiont of Dictyostelium giganteum]|uniref:V-type ATP synthase subunit I n=1 Tax=Rhabdochlamydiaceae symbiont of Dictyostelium giganteum TaxID=3342349 RepID=UPI00384D71DD